MDILKLVQENANHIKQIAARYGATDIRLFGSVARGTATENSDIDFMTTFTRTISMIDRISLMMELEELLQRKVQVVREANLKSYVREDAMKDAVLI